MGVLGLALVALAGCRLITTPEASEPEAIALSPSMAQVEEDETLKLRVTDANRADSREVTGIGITWESLDPAVATVQDGVVRGVRIGEARVRARLESGTVAETTIEVTRTPAAIALIAGNPQVGEVADVLPSPIEARVVSRAGRPVVGAEVRFHVRKGAGSTSPVVAVADTEGVVRGVWTLGHVAGEQLLELEVRNTNGIRAEAKAEAMPAPAQEVVVQPSSVSLRKGASVPLSAMVTDRYGNVLGEYAAAWTSSNPIVARVSASGIVTAVTEGRTQVEAVPMQEGPSAAPASVIADLAASSVIRRGNSHIVVSDGESDDGGDDGVGSVSITGGDNQSGIVGTQLGRDIEIRILDSSGKPVRHYDVSWVVMKGNGQTSETTTRTNGQGRASVSWTLGPVAGEQVVEARAGSHGTATFTATAVAGAVEVVQVTPGSAEVGVGGSTTLAARALDRYGNEVTGKSVTWSVENTSVASVSSNGVAKGTSVGSTRVVASVEGVKGTGDLRVGEEGVGNEPSVQITPDSAVVNLGESLQLSATVLDASGSVVSDPGLEWSSLHPDIASVDNEGVVLSKAVGIALIAVSAACCDVADTAVVHVAGSPETVQDLKTVSSTDASVTLRWTQVDDGAGNPARYAVRFASPEVTWSLAVDSEKSVDGDKVGSPMEVELNGMSSTTQYEFQLVAYRGELNNGAKFGDLSNKDQISTLEASGDGGSDDDGVGQSAGHPNEPAGFTTWFHHDFSYLPTGTGTGDRLSASHAGVLRIISGLSNHQVVKETDAPHGQPHSLRRLFPKGLPDGTTGGVWHAKNSDASFEAQNDLDEWYVSFWVKLEGPTWENPPGGVQKIWYNQVGLPGTPRGGSQNFRHALDANGNTIGTGDPASAYNWIDTRWTSANGGEGNYVGKRFEVGQWYHIEQWGKMSDLDQSNGFLRTYVDGEFVGSAENIANRSSSRPGGFYGIHFAPVWGGSCGTTRCPKEKDDYMRIADFYISGR